MEQKAPAVVEADDPLTALYRRLNYFPTPPWAARAMADLIRRIDPGARTIWDPACGEGHMAEGFADIFGRENVISSDIHPFGYSEVHDFLLFDSLFGPGRRDEWRNTQDRIDWVGTNPPFDKAEDFIRCAMDIAGRGVAMLCRLALLESVERFDLIFGETYPLHAFAPFSERVAMQLGSWNPNLHSATAYGVFVWLKDSRISNDPPGRIIPIPPGTRAKFSRPDDARRFGKREPMPLFDGALA